MSKVTVYNLEGKAVEEIELNPEFFDIAMNEELVTQVLRVQRANAREAIAHTKTRGEVSGGGKKPWKQKGTGRARHGSIRSPLWIGGGITFGPRSDRNFSLKINKKMKKKALLMTLSEKARDGQLMIVDSFVLPEAKTKRAVSMLKNLKITTSALFALGAKNEGIRRAVANVKKVNTLLADSLNVEDVLVAKTLVIEKSALPIIEKTYKA